MGCLPCLFFLASLTFFPLFHAETAQIERRTYIVHMDTFLMPKAFSTRDNWYSSTVDSLNSANFDGHLSSATSLIYTYNHALDGFSVFLSVDELEALKKTPGFISAYRNKIIKLDSTHTPEFLSLNHSDDLWPDSNFGEDIIVGVLDSGIWPESKSFNDKGIPAKYPSRWKGKCEEGESFNSSLCNFKLIGVRYFNDTLKKEYSGLIIGMNSARDTNAHGTYAASIVAGNYVDDVSSFGYAKGTAKGVAPRARLAIYKISWDGEASFSDIVAGMDHAIADGVDVINISMGPEDMPLQTNPIAIASFRAVKKGVLVSTSAGNKGLALGTVHNGFPWVLTVTSGSVDRWFAGHLALGTGETIIGWTMSPSNAPLQDLPLVYNVFLSACDKRLSSKKVDGIIICNDIGSIDSQISQITTSNVKGAVLIVDNPKFFEVGGPLCPCVVINSMDASLVINYAKTNIRPSATITFQHTILGIKPAPTVASYASRGSSQSFPSILKPDIMAPGSLVLGAWIPEKPIGRFRSILYYSDYYIWRGTSGACPQAAGVIALLKAMHPDWSPSAIKSAIMTTATPFDNSFKPIRDNGNKLQPASPLAMGAGQIQPNHALDPGLIYDATPQDYVNFLCSMDIDMKDIKAVIGSEYDCKTPYADLNYPSFVVLYCDNIVKVWEQEFHRIVTNVGQGAATYDALVRAPEDSQVVVSPTRLVFGNKYDNQSFTLNITYKGNRNSHVSFGELVWIEENRNHMVRSPIVVSPMVHSRSSTLCR